MKTVRIVLLVLIILGIGLLFTQKMWVPYVVSAILEHEGRPEVLEITDSNPAAPSDSMEHWVLSPVSSQGTQFMYPASLPTTFVHAENWPPQVAMVAGDFSCVRDEEAGQDSLFNQQMLRMVADRTYCVTISSEGAAGSTYTSYEYITQQGDFLVQVSFMLRMPQCMNYDEPEQSACKTEQAHFDADILADQIALSLRMH